MNYILLFFFIEVCDILFYKMLNVYIKLYMGLIFLEFVFLILL